MGVCPEKPGGKPKFRPFSEFQPRRGDLARIIGAIGLDGLRNLQKTFGGRKIWIPKETMRASCGFCRRRDECVSRWYRGAVGAGAISRFVGISTKRIYQIVGKGAFGAGVKIPGSP